MSAHRESHGGIDSISDKFWIGLAIVLGLLAITLRYTSLNTHDNSWLLYITGEFLNGSTLYVDLVEVNPPLVIALYSPAVIVAKLLALEVHYVFYAYVIILAALSSALVLYLADKSVITNRALLTVLLTIALLILPRENFGQREHFMVIFALPYIFLAIRRWHDLPCASGLALAIGLLAVAGFGLKHYFVLIPAVLELCLLIKSRQILRAFRPETIALGAGLVVYVGLIFLFTPDYIERIIPMAFAVYVDGFSMPLLKVISSIELIVLVLALALAALILAQGGKLTGSIVLLLATGLAGFVIYVMQKKGWNYHAYPALVFLFIGCGLMMAHWSKMVSWRATTFAAMTMGILVLLALPILSLMDYRYKNVTIEPWQRVIAANQPVTSFYVMSSLLSPGFPLTNISHLTWASRFPSLWLLPGIAQATGKDDARANKKIAEIERYQIDSIVADFERFRPQIVFVDAREKMTHYGGISFKFIDYFSKDARFRAIWVDYEKIGSDTFGFEHYRLKQP